MYPDSNYFIGMAREGCLRKKIYGVYAVVIEFVFGTHVGDV
jgi:hypothetical protein